MNGWIITLLVVLILLLLGQIRVGTVVEYSAHGLLVQVRLGAMRIQVFPGKKKKKPVLKEKPKPSSTKKTSAKKKGGRLKLVLDFLPLVLDTVGRFRRKLRVDKLDVELTVGSDDPADAALQYGKANALLGSIWHPLTQALHVKDGHAHVELDFETKSPIIYIFASLSLRVNQGMALAVVFAVNALRILIRTKNKRNKPYEEREAV